MQKLWTKILLVVNVGSLVKRSNRTRSRKATAKLIQNKVYCFFISFTVVFGLLVLDSLILRCFMQPDPCLLH